MRRDRETISNATDSAILDLIEAMVADPTEAVSANQYFKDGVSRGLYRDISARETALSSYIAGDVWWMFDEAVVSEYCIENLCIYLYAFEKANGDHPVDDSFSRLIRDAIDSVDEAARKRTPRLWYDVYSKPERVQALRETTIRAVTRPKRRGDPGFDPEEAELVMSIRQDDVLAFKGAHQSGKLPADIDPRIESGANALFMLMIELHLKSILCFCIEEGIVEIDTNINDYTPLQWSVMSGAWTTAATLLDLGANASVLFHNKFVEEVITFGCQRSINILYYVQAVASSYPHICRSQEPIEHIVKFDFNEKRFKTRPTDDEPSNIEKACCKSMNPLQWAVGLFRPIFVGALIDAGANPNVRTADTLETPLHELAQLDATRWPNKWIYGDSEALRAPEDTRKDDQIHADIILEILLRAPTIDKEARSADGATPFLAACKSGNVRMCRRLASADANPFARMLDGRGALHLAVEARNSELVDYLCREWPEIMKMKDFQHRTPLIATVASSAGEILAVIVVPPQATPSVHTSQLPGFRILGVAQQNFKALEILFGHYEAADPGSVNKALSDKDTGSNASSPQGSGRHGVIRRARLGSNRTKDLDANTTEPRAAPPLGGTTDASGTASHLSSLDGYRIRQRLTASRSLVLDPLTGLASRIIRDEFVQQIRAMRLGDETASHVGAETHEGEAKRAGD
ncbi:ankyrin repeat-containing domain protein [Cladorrhinum sp. PSN332]|nr:ankyrin repeat-containing domain protein [Cladorrhinum sp. PSN332]